MFIKVTTTAGRRYAQLVESFRNEAGQPRQRTLATLGRLEPDGDVDLHRVLRMRLREHQRTESPMRLLDQLTRIQLQTVQSADGQLLHGLTDLKAAQKELFVAIGAATPTPAQLHAPNIDQEADSATM